MCFQYVMLRPVMYGMGVSTPPKVEIGNHCARHWLGQVRVCFACISKKSTECSYVWCATLKVKKRKNKPLSKQAKLIH